MKKPDYDYAKQTALQILERLNIVEPPVNPYYVAKQLGIAAYSVDFYGEAQQVSGYYDANEHAIYVNREEYPLRQHFTAAHELGHSQLHKDWVKTDDYQVLLRDDNAPKDWREKEADNFAANLLVPRFMLNQYYDWVPIERLSRLFSVSVPVIKNRLAWEYGI